MSCDSSSVSVLGNTDNSQQFIDAQDLQDLIKPDVLVTKPNKDMSSIELKLEEVVEKDQFLKVSSTESQPVKVFLN